MDRDPRVSGATVANAMAAKVETCKFFAKGSCERGKDCRFAHEMKTKKSPKGDGKGSSKEQQVSNDQCFNSGK